MVKVKNMISTSSGRAVENQFIIEDEIHTMSGNAVEYFQSYDSIIVRRDKFRAGEAKRQVTLDEKYWNYSRTTSKYRNQFLGETTKETKAKIKSGEYELVNLNN